MNASSIVYATAKKIGYPLFLPKLHDVSGMEYLPRHGGFIIAANHVDWLDGFYIAAALGAKRNVRVFFLAKSNTYRWTTLTLHIPPAKGAIIDQAVCFLQNGRVICNFPEGQRNNGRQLLPGKTGTVRMAIAAGVPVVPMGITCSAGKNVGQSLLFLMSKNHQVHIRIGEPLRFSAPPSGVTPEYLASATSQLMRAIAPLAGKSTSL